MKSLMIMTIAACALALTGPATATQLFDFDAQAVMPGTIGDSAEVYGVIVNGNAVDTPLPLDFGSYQYTIVITGLVLDDNSGASVFSGGSIAIYADAGTAADYTNTASFTDGSAILSGSVTSFVHNVLIGSIGSGQGYVDWTGGSRLNELAPADQLNWPLLTSTNSSASYVEPGFTHLFDGKVEPGEEVVASENSSLSAVKALFR